MLGSLLCMSAALTSHRLHLQLQQSHGGAQSARKWKTKVIL